MTLFTSIVNDDMPCGGLHNIDDDEKNIVILSYPIQNQLTLQEGQNGPPV